MRALATPFLIATAVFSIPAFAEDWSTYENPRYGFTLEVPGSGWDIQPEPENGDGRAWYSTDGRSTIRAWGSNLLDGFKADAEMRVASEKEKGWTITSDINWNMDLKDGPEGWHVYSASLDGRVVQQKAIVNCGGEQAVYVRLEYFESQFVDFLPISDRLISSLKPKTGDGCSTN